MKNATFIELYENAFSDQFCDKLIEYFYTQKNNNEDFFLRKKNENILGLKKNDEYIILKNVPEVKEFYSSLYNKYLPKYADKYDGFRQDIVKLRSENSLKVQKTE